MNYKNGIALGSMFLQAITAFSAEEVTTKPNIVLIMTDQQSYNMVSALSKYYSHINNYASTPNIDRLVNSGIAFTNTYCANPVSLPSRFALFTGEYGGKYGVTGNTPTVDFNVMSAVYQRSAMGVLFKNNGYETFYGGKVHLPYPYPNKPSYYNDPLNYGFTNYFSGEERDGLAIDAVNLIKNRTSTTPMLLVLSFLNPHDICAENGSNISPIVNVDPLKPDIAKNVNLFRDKVASYDSVYFYSNIAPALPFNFAKQANYPASASGVFKTYPDYYWRKYRWIYSEMTTQVDTSIGKFLDAIDQWSQKNNTIIIFTSDHGEMQGAHHTVLKELPFDECQRVPFIISGKGIVQNQADNSLICNGTDMIPTMCELAGIPIPSSLKGISLAKRATINTPVTQRSYLYLEGSWFKQILQNPSYKYTLLEKNTPNEILINLSNDRGEMNNVCSSNSTNINKTTELRTILNNEMATGIDPTYVSTINIFPNPASNYIILTGITEYKDVHIYNLFGKEISNFISNHSVLDNSLQISISDLPKGIYILKTNKFSGKFSIK